MPCPSVPYTLENCSLVNTHGEGVLCDSATYRPKKQGTDTRHYPQPESWCALGSIRQSGPPLLLRVTEPSDPEPEQRLVL